MTAPRVIDYDEKLANLVNSIVVKASSNSNELVSAISLLASEIIVKPYTICGTVFPENGQVKINVPQIKITEDENDHEDDDYGL